MKQHTDKLIIFQLFNLPSLKTVHFNLIYFIFIFFKYILLLKSWNRKTGSTPKRSLMFWCGARKSESDSRGWGAVYNWGSLMECVNSIRPTTKFRIFVELTFTYEFCFDL